MRSASRQRMPLGSVHGNPLALSPLYEYRAHRLHLQQCDQRVRTPGRALSGAGSSDNGSIVGYAWDFGDGTSATGVTQEQVLR